MRYVRMTLVLFLSVCAAYAAPKDKEKTQDIRKFTFNWHSDLKPAWYDETPGVLDHALKSGLADVKEVIFAARGNGGDWHWYANFGYNIKNENRFYHAGVGGLLCAFDLRTKEMRILLEDKEGDIRDPAVHYDGKTILFSYRKTGTNQFHLYTIQSDGTGLTQLTDGEFDDIEPCWLPDGGIMFCSSRCMRWVPCWYAQVAIMYRCEADGSDLKPISFGVENENTPWPMADGRVLYTRWEYVDRGQSSYHGLWAINPDGTNVELIYDNMGTMNLYIDAKPIPGTGKLISIISPKHGRNEHRGRLGIIDPDFGTESEKAARFLDRGYPLKTSDKRKGHVPSESWRDPYAVSANCFLAATKHALVVMNGDGDYEIIYELPDKLRGSTRKGRNLHEPRPLVARKREPVIPHVKPSKDGMATFVVMDVNVGRKMKGIEKGQVKSLLVMEELPRPGANCAYSDAISNGSNYVLHRILGRVPVEQDGSAHFKAPAGRPIFFYALDEHELSAKTMPSYLSAMPGELVSCVGCHEDRAQTAAFQGKRQVTMALKREPSSLKRTEGIPEIFDYVRDIQPIWDKHCISCHNIEKNAGNLRLVGDMTASWTVSYHQVKKVREAFGKRRNRLIANGPGYEPAPYKTASGGSDLIKMLMKGHKNVKLSELELTKLKRWADAGTNFAGTYAALDSVDRAERIRLSNKRDKAYTERMKPVRDMIDKRCVACHKDRRGNYWIEGELRGTGHRYNMTNPEKSLILLAPLAKSAGGLELCKPKKRRGKVDKNQPETPIFRDRSDPDFKMLEQLVSVVKEQQGHPRWIDDDHKPVFWYIREMKRFGALPKDFDPEKDKLNGYEVDARYFNNIYRQGPGPQPKEEGN